MNLTFNLKSQFILSISSAFILGFIFSFFKNEIGFDEKIYISNGESILKVGFENVKNLPFISILFQLFVLPFENQLIGLRVMYIFSLTLISAIQFYFTFELGEKKFPIISSLLILVVPGIAVLNLYSLANLVSTSMLMFGLFLVSLYIKGNKVVFLFLIGIFFSLLYQSRNEFLFIFLMLILSWPFLVNYQNKKLKLVFRDLSIIILSFILILFPWQYFLYEKNLYFIVTGNDGAKGWRTVNNFIFSESFFTNFIMNMKAIIIIIIKNGFEHLKNLGSPKLFPIFFLPLIGIGFLKLIKNNILYIFMTPLIIFIPLCGFYHPDYNLIRMFTPILPLLCVCLSMFVTYSSDSKNNYLKVKFLSIFFILVLYSMIFFIFGNTTYK